MSNSKVHQITDDRFNELLKCESLIKKNADVLTVVIKGEEKHYDIKVMNEDTSVHIKELVEELNNSRSKNRKLNKEIIALKEELLKITKEQIKSI